MMYPMEGHFVHAAEDGQLAVIGVFYKHGEPNPFLAQVWDDMPMRESAPRRLPNEVSSGSLGWDTQRYFRLMGSLTTPPCSEGVVWTLLSTIQEASVEQIQKFKDAIGNHPNNRPVCPLYNRMIC